MTLRCKIKKVKRTKKGFTVTLKCPGRGDIKRYEQSLRETNIQLG